MRGMVWTLLMFSCHRTESSADPGPPASCIIEHDGGVTQCYDEIGATAKQQGAALCKQMHGKTSFRVGTPCPTDGLLMSCQKAQGTEVERIERCYREPKACETRCLKAQGVLTNAM